MNILLFGVSNVGKTSVGRLVAEKLCCDFYDLDDEIKTQLNVTIEDFVSSGSLVDRDGIRCSVLCSLSDLPGDKVIAVAPVTYIDGIIHLFSDPDTVTIELTDSARNIFKRLVFSDRNDSLYEDDDYKNLHKKHYLDEIRADLDWYGSIYSVIKRRFHISGKSPEEAADAIISAYHLA